VQIRFNDTGVHARENQEVPKLSVLGLNFLEKQLALNILLFRIFFARCKPLLEFLDVIPFSSTTLALIFTNPGKSRKVLNSVNYEDPPLVEAYNLLTLVSAHCEALSNQKSRETFPVVS
jgi:hypothetical protein